MFRSFHYLCYAIPFDEFFIFYFIELILYHFISFIMSSESSQSLDSPASEAVMARLLELENRTGYRESFSVIYLCCVPIFIRV